MFLGNLSWTGQSRPWGSKSHLTVAVDQILVAAKFCQPHRAAGVQLVGADANLGTESELATVVKTGARIPEHHGRVHFMLEPGGYGGIFGNDDVRVVGAIGVDVLDGFVSA